MDNSANLVTEIFDEAGHAVTGFTGVLNDGMSGVTQLFYANGQLTVLGTLLVVGIGVGVVYFGFRLIRSLLHRA